MFAPTSTVSGENSRSTISTLSSFTASPKETGRRDIAAPWMCCLRQTEGIIRAHGVSCHSIQALRAAAASPWVEIDLVRLNPIGSHMDADPDTVISVIKQMRSSGKGIVGMKILGQGDLRSHSAEAIRYALGAGVLDAFTIGAESKNEQNNLVQRIAAA